MDKFGYTDGYARTIDSINYSMIVFLLPVVSGGCNIEILSWGGEDSTALNGYVRVNGEVLLSVNSWYNRGISTFIVNRANCTASSVQNFDTYADQSVSDQFASYLLTLPPGTVLIGVSFNDAARSLTPAAYGALADLGVNITGFAYHWKLAFAVIIGSPQLSVAKMQRAGGINLIVDFVVMANTIYGMTFSFTVIQLKLLECKICWVYKFAACMFCILTTK